MTVGDAGAPTEAGDTSVLKAPKIVELVVLPGLVTEVAPEVIARTFTVLTVP